MYRHVGGACCERKKERTRNPEVLSSRQRKRTVKERSSSSELSVRSASISVRPESPASWLLHVNWRCSSSRSSECTSSYTDWWTTSDWSHTHTHTMKRRAHNQSTAHSTTRTALASGASVTLCALIGPEGWWRHLTLMGLAVAASMVGVMTSCVPWPLIWLDSDSLRSHWSGKKDDDVIWLSWDWPSRLRWWV